MTLSFTMSAFEAFLHSASFDYMYISDGKARDLIKLVIIIKICLYRIL